MKKISDMEIEKIIDSLTGIHPASPDPFFYTRLKARMGRSDEPVFLSLFAWIRPAIIFPLLCFILLLNIVTVIHKKQATGQAKKIEKIEGSSSVIQSVAQDYDLSISTY